LCSYIFHANAHVVFDQWKFQPSGGTSGAIFQEKLFEKIDIKHIILRSEKKGQYGIWFNNLTTTLEDP